LGEADCGVTTCSLYQGGGSCNVDYVTTNDQITLVSDNIIVKRNVAAGFGPESICYKCESDQ